MHCAKGSNGRCPSLFLTNSNTTILTAGAKWAVPPAPEDGTTQLLASRDGGRTWTAPANFTRGGLLLSPGRLQERFVGLVGLV